MIQTLRKIAVKAACTVAGTALLVLLPATAHAASTGQASATHPQLAAAAHSTAHTSTARPVGTAAASSDAPRSVTPHVSCNGYTCDGQWPDISGCAATAITPVPIAPITNNGTVIGQVELRYSTACRTVWARVENWSGLREQANVLRITGPSGAQVCDTNYWSSTLGAYSCYTRMLYDGGVTSDAQGGVWDGNGNSHINKTASF